MSPDSKARTYRSMIKQIRGWVHLSKLSLMFITSISLFPFGICRSVCFVSVLWVSLLKSAALFYCYKSRKHWAVGSIAIRGQGEPLTLTQSMQILKTTKYALQLTIWNVDGVNSSDIKISIFSLYLFMFSKICPKK